MYYFGVDIGGTFIKIGVSDGKNKLLYKTSVKTEVKSGYKAAVVKITEEIKKIEKEKGLSPVGGIGVTVPGVVDSETGRIVEATNLGWSSASITEDIERLTGVPCFAGNDGNLAALGEYRYGLKRGKRPSSMVLLTLGTGVGSGIIINGKVFAGYKDAGAEIGHMVIAKGGVKCNCGRHGCFEKYASATALISFAKDNMLKDKNSLLWQAVGGNTENLCGKVIFECMRKKDTAARKAVMKFSDYLATGVANVVNILRPELVLIGGGISANYDCFLERTVMLVRSKVLIEHGYSNFDIKIASLGNDAGIYGAIAMAKGKSARK